MRKTAFRLAIAFFCALGPTAACFAADEPAKTAETRDTLIYVRTDPAGAAVFIDGKKIGASNGLFRVESGTVTISAELEGREPSSKQVTIRANRITRVELILKPAAKTGKSEDAGPPHGPAAEAGSRQTGGSSTTADGGGAKDAQPTAPTSARLSYRFQAGKQYAYEIKIEAELQDTIEAREGVSTYDVLSANQEQMVLKQSGALRVQTKPRPGHVIGPPRFGFPGFPGPHFPAFGPSGPEGITINHEGHLVLSKPLTHLPFLLGDLETLVIEELPADGKLSWQRVRDVLAIERKSSGFPPIGPLHRGTQSERPAKEQIDYALIDAQPEAVRIKKTYSFHSAKEADGSAHFDMSGSGEFTFDRRQGVIRTLSMKYTVSVNEPNLTLRVPVSLNCRLLSAEELAAHKRKEEENRIAAEQANAPKPIAPTERAALLEDLRLPTGIGRRQRRTGWPRPSLTTIRRRWSRRWSPCSVIRTNGWSARRPRRWRSGLRRRPKPP